MRTSLIALALLAAAGALGYAVVNDKLPPELKTPLDRAMSWGRGLLDGAPRTAPTAQQPAPQPADAMPAARRRWRWRAPSPRLRKAPSARSAR
jgi:hypothetical protein